MPRLLLLALCVACTDLPEGWDDAEPIEITQSDCKGSVIGSGETEEIQTSQQGSVVELNYVDAHFRCDQAVEGFARRGEDSVDLLFQPVDMNPSAVARCDCRYDLKASVLFRNETKLSVWRRWDSVGGEKAPVLVGERKLAR